MKTMKNMIILAMIFVAFNTGMATTKYSDNGEIRGTVTDSATGMPMELANVVVWVNGTPYGSASAADGSYSIKPVPAGVYTLQASFTGYNIFKITEVIVRPNTITFINPQLSTAIGKEVTITARRFETDLIKVDNPTLREIPSSQIERMPRIGNIKDLAALGGTDIYKKDDGKELYFRGSRAGSVKYYLDGVSVSGEIQLPSKCIGGMSIYTGGVPAMYGDITGGVVIINTKSFFDLYGGR